MGMVLVLACADARCVSRAFELLGLRQLPRAAAGDLRERRLRAHLSLVASWRADL